MTQTMIRLEEAHLLAAFVNAMFLVAFILMPIGKSLSYKTEYSIYNRSRWFAVVTQIFMTSYYVLQRVFEIRHTSVHYAACLNFFLITPAMVMFSLNTFNLTYFGKIKRWVWYVVGLLLATAYFVLVPVVLTDFYTPDTPDKLFSVAEHFLSFAISGVFFILNFIQIKRFVYLNKVLEGFYDVPKSTHAIAMRIGVILFALWTITYPTVIFTTDELLLYLHCLLGVFAIFIHRVGFMLVGIDGYAAMYKPIKESIVQADKMANDAELTEEAMSPLSSPKVDEWLRTGHQFRSGITVLEIASEIGISPDELRRYFRSHGFQKVGSWLASLRVEEAKRMLIEHPEYGFDYVAEKCGFSSREYFHACFRNLTGMPPAQWQDANRKR